MNNHVSISSVFEFGIIDHPTPDDERPDSRQVAAAKLWLASEGLPRKKLSVNSSYGFKHQCERWLTKQGYFMSITNGAMIVALIESGFTVRRAKAGNPNVYAGIKIRETKQHDPMRPRSR